MAAEVDICNTGLGHLGDDAVITAISPPDGSVQAGHCARFYPMARDQLLERYPWRFNTQRAILALSPVAAPVGWAFAYQLPSQCVKPIAVLAPGQLPDFISWWQGVSMTDMSFSSNLTDILNSKDFIVEASPTDGTPILYTNVQQATLIYSLGVTDTTKFTPLFIAALARLLAAYLAGPIVKGTTGMKVAEGQLKFFLEVDYPAAVNADANARQVHPYSSATPAPIAARL